MGCDWRRTGCNEAVTHHGAHQRASCTKGPARHLRKPVMSTASTCRMFRHGRGKQTWGGGEEASPKPPAATSCFAALPGCCVPPTHPGSPSTHGRLLAHPKQHSRARHGTLWPQGQAPTPCPAGDRTDQRSWRPLHPGQLPLLLQYFHNFALHICIRSILFLTRSVFFPTRATLFLSTPTFSPVKLCFTTTELTFTSANWQRTHATASPLGRRLLPCENMAPSLPIPACLPPAQFEAAMVNLATNAMAGGLDAWQPHPHCHCPRHRLAAPSWLPSAAHSRHLARPLGPLSPPRHCQHFEIDFFVFVTSCWRQIHRLGNTAWAADGSPPRFSLSGRPAGRQACALTRVAVMVSRGSGQREQEQNHLFLAPRYLSNSSLDSLSLHLTEVAGAARTAAAALSSTALLDSPRSAAKVTPLFFFILVKERENVLVCTLGSNERP